MFQLFDCESFLVFLVFNESKLNIFQLYAVGQTKLVISRRHFGLRDLVIDIFCYLLTFYKPIIIGGLFDNEKKFS